MKKIAFLLMCLLAGCSSQPKLKIAATPTPHAEILQLIQPDLEKEGIHLKIIEVDDYAVANRLLAEKQVDANFFQHPQFLNEQKKQFGYQLEVLVAVHLEPLGIYSHKISCIGDLQNGASVAIPSDPTNEGRALDLLVEVGLITLKPLCPGEYPTVLSIDQNPRCLKIKEMDAALLPRVLPDVSIAVIPANFALQGKLSPCEDALVLECEDSPYANIVVIREGDENEAFAILKRHLQSEKVRAFLRQKELEPAF